MDLATTKPKRSVKLTPDEMKRLRDFVDKHGALEAVFTLRVDRANIERVLRFGSTSEKTANSIRLNLPK